MQGRYVEIRPGVRAFVPAPLPPEGWLTPGIVRRLSEADRAIGQLAATGKALPNPHLLIRPFIRQEAVLSSRIEGTQTDERGLVEFQATGEAEQPQDAQEVANYVKALDFALARVRQLPLGKTLLAEIHGMLMSGLAPDPGQYRQVQNWIGLRGAPLENASFVPPPPDVLPEALDELERFLREDTELPPLVRAAMAHHQFETIHPFTDGNGRTGRLLITLILCVEDVLPQPLLYLSAYFEQDRRAYYDHLAVVRDDAERGWEQWLTYFLRGVEVEARDATRRVDELIALRERFRQLVIDDTAALKLHELIDHLFATPMLTTQSVMDQLGVTAPTAGRYLDLFEARGIVVETSGKQRGRRYLAQDIIAAARR